MTDLQEKAPPPSVDALHAARAVPTRRDPDHHRGEGCYVCDSARQALSRRAVGSVRRAGRARPRASSPRRRPGNREQLGYFPVWSYGHAPAIELAARLADLAPGDLNRVFFTTGGSEAVESAWKLARQYFRGDRPAPPAQGHQPQHRVPRHDVRRAVDHRRARRSRAPFEPLVAGRDQGAEHRPVPLHRLLGTSTRARCAAPTTSSNGSSWRAPRPSPRSSSSRCRTPAAASCRRRATSSACGRSATATACCSCPTR